MLVLQPCPQGVQPAVIVPRITFALDSIVIIEEMAVRVEQSFDFQYLLQLGQRPAILVMLSRVAAVLFRQYIDIIDELMIVFIFTSKSFRLRMRTNDLKAGHEPDCQRRTWIILPVKATKKPATLMRKWSALCSGIGWRTRV